MKIRYKKNGFSLAQRCRFEYDGICLEKKEGKRYVSWIVSLGEMPDLRPVGLVARVGAGTCRAGEKTA